MNLVKFSFFELLIIEHLDFQGSDYPEPQDYLNRLFLAEKIFKSEKSIEIEKFGELESAINWLSGLCSTISLPFYNEDIVALGVKYGALDFNPTPRQVSNFISNFYSNCAKAFLKLLERAKK